MCECSYRAMDRHGTQIGLFSPEVMSLVDVQPHAAWCIKETRAAIFKIFRYPGLPPLTLRTAGRGCAGGPIKAPRDWRFAALGLKHQSAWSLRVRRSMGYRNLRCE